MRSRLVGFPGVVAILALATPQVATAATPPQVVALLDRGTHAAWFFQHREKGQAAGLVGHVSLKHDTLALETRLSPPIVLVFKTRAEASAWCVKVGSLVGPGGRWVDNGPGSLLRFTLCTWHGNLSLIYMPDSRRISPAIARMEGLISALP
jgi:hypothetical protein